MFAFFCVSPIIINTTIEEELINITMYHSRRERTQGHCGPFANGTYNSTMVANSKKKEEFKGVLCIPFALDIVLVCLFARMFAYMLDQHILAFVFASFTYFILFLVAWLIISLLFP